MLSLLLLLACADAPDPTPPPEAEEAVADLFSAVGTTTRVQVRGRVLAEAEGSDLPARQASQEELDRAEVEIALVGADGKDVLARTVRADEEGQLDAALDFPAVAPGAWQVVARLGGREIGRAPARLLAPEHADPVVRSDIDLTYLWTDFQSKSGLAGLLVQGASERQALPGMPELYQGLQGPSPDAWRPVTFLSGSPTFFKRTLEGRMALDGIRHAGIVLKPMKDIATGGEVPLDEIVAALHEQVGYKLFWLLKLRAEIPPGTPEILMGDDSEADFVVYNLYERLTTGELSLADLGRELEALGVAPLWREAIANGAPAALAHLAGTKPVIATYIHDTGKPSAIPLAPWVLPGRTRVHGSAWSLALDLHEESWIDAQSVDRVCAALVAKGEPAESLQAEAQAAVSAGWLRAETASRAYPGVTSAP